MLVCSRKTNERMVITTPEGRLIRMTIVELRGDKVRVGFEADRDVVIDRQEIWEMKQPRAVN